jgi:hypothetical protein
MVGGCQHPSNLGLWHAIEFPPGTPALEEANL